MKIKADFDSCEANAVCESIAPEVFFVDDQDFLHLKLEDVTPELEQKVRDAVNRCPKAALSIVED